MPEPERARPDSCAQPGLGSRGATGSGPSGQTTDARVVDRVLDGVRVVVLGRVEALPVGEMRLGGD